MSGKKVISDIFLKFYALKTKTVHNYNVKYHFLSCNQVHTLQNFGYTFHRNVKSCINVTFTLLFFRTIKELKLRCFKVALEEK